MYTCELVTTLADEKWSAAMLFRNKLYCVITLKSIIPPFLQQNQLLNHVQ